jgi:hypothetical protein
LRAFAIVLTITGMPLFGTFAAMADGPVSRLAGTWKLIVLALGEDEYAIINVDEKDGKPEASVASTQRTVLGDARVDQIAIRGDSLVIALRGTAGLNRFQGMLARESSHAGKILGSFSFRGEVYPARLERTESHTVADLRPSAIIQEYFTAVRERDPKAKVQKLRDVDDATFERPIRIVQAKTGKAPQGRERLSAPAGRQEHRCHHDRHA